MKTITTVEQLDALSDRAVIKAADEEILVCIGSGQPDGDGNVWQDEESCWLGSSDVELPATLIYPLVFDAADVHVATGAASTADRYRELHPSQAETIARAVLGAVGSVEA